MAWFIFMRVCTQWRTTANAIIGLDYMPLFALLDREGLCPERWMQIFDDVRTIEATALEKINAK